ncbi:Crp/Fnr family transcriptional regulator [Rufibacter soli]
MFQLLEKYIKDRASVEPATLDYICSHFSDVRTKRNQLLLHYGDVCQHYYFVNKGAIRVFTLNKEGQEASRYFAFEGQFGTALPSFIEQQPALEYLQTIEPSQLLQISRKDFFQLVDTIPAFAAIYRQIVETGFINAQKRIYGFQGFDALEKLQWVLQQQPDFLARVSNKMAASYLGLSPSTLSRLKARL